jgi:hypothetical protein
MLLKYALIPAVFCTSLVSPILASDPPRDLAKRIAERETQSEAVRAQYMYRQQLLIEEFDKRNVRAGDYSEQREVIFSPAGERTEKVTQKATDRLVRLKLTPEDFRDIQEIQPLLLTKERLWLYQTQPRGEETVEGVPCWVLEVKPRQILDGQRLFEGLLWASQADFSVVRSEGRAVPQILSKKDENLFPRFTTIRHQQEGGYWFPRITFADDTLPFRSGPLRLRMKLEFSQYQRFGAESTIRFEAPKP